MKNLFQRLKQSSLRFLIPTVSRHRTLCISLFATGIVALSTWILLGASQVVRIGAWNLIVNAPDFTRSGYAYVLLGVITILAAFFYFYIDYKQHVKPFNVSDITIGYSPMHHARVVMLPRLKYNWKQSLSWIGYGLISIFVISSVLALQTKTAFAYAPNEFVTTWQTKPEGYQDWFPKDITIPTSGAGYNYTVDWGDGSVIAGYTGNATHNYAAHGVYTVKITGTFPRFYIGNTDVTKLLTVEQWGTNHWSSMEYAFNGAENLTVPATDVPDLSGVTSLKGMFTQTKFNQNINNWDVSTITDMSTLFNGTPFNQPLNNWDTSKVTDMSGMFSGTANNQPLNDWDVSSVTNMNSMFSFNTTFNQPLNNWNVSNVENMFWMFRGATSFNQSLGSWSVANVTNMTGMFIGTGLSVANYDSTLVGWSGQSLKSNVTLGAWFLKYCSAASARANIISSFNWTIYDAGQDCPPSEPFITTWKTDNPGVSASNQITIPTAGGGYNYTVDWGDTSTDTGVTGPITHTYASAGTYEVKISGTFPRISFHGQNSFTCSGSGSELTDRQKILTVSQWGNNQWDTMESAFAGARNMQITAADAPDLTNVTDLSNMFDCARALNSNINNWDVSTITSMYEMFRGASTYNQPLGSWDVANVTNMNGMFSAAHAFDQDISSWNVARVTSFSWMFDGAFVFNQPVGDWDVSSAEGMYGMFANTTLFNQALTNWNVSSVTSMASMFDGATSFDKSLANWDVSSVTDMTSMLSNSSLSTSNYDAILIGWSQQSLKSGVQLGTSAHYCTAETQRQSMIANFSWTISDAGKDCSAPVDFTNAFVTTWKTDNPGDSDDNQITIPTVAGVPGYESMAYNYGVDWGDGTVSTGMTDDATHSYASPGTYTVKIIGSFPAISLCLVNEAQNGLYTDARKLLTVEQWGDITWETMNCAFGGASNLTIPATDVPDLSSVTDTTRMFFGATAFNQNINNWDVSNIEEMYGMFQGATSFNQPLNNWDVSQVVYTAAMFDGATSFNQPLDSWDTRNVEHMDSMFRYATSFNQNINSWDISKAETINHMFARATSFNQPLNNWDTGSVSGGVDMEGVFGFATSFNQNISSWDVSNVEDMYGMFWGASSFNQPLNNWDTGSVRVMGNMFMNATSFNQNINSWDTTNVYYFMLMFAGASSFNQPLNNWDTGGGQGMTAMFAGASAFDQSLANWDVSQVQDMSYMFNKDSLDLGGGFVFTPAHGLSTANYDATLASWSAQGLVGGVNFDAGASTYCSSVAQRASIISSFNWTINDSGKNCSDDSKFAHTDQPSKSSSTTAKLNGSISGVGAGNFVSAGFDWGATPAFGDSVGGIAITDNQFSHETDFKCGTQYYYRAYAIDSNNTKTYGATVVFALECTGGQVNNGPIIQITAPKNGESFEVEKDITLAAEASDSDGSIKEVRFYLNGKMVGVSYKAPYTLTVQSSVIGSYTFVAVAEDNDGNKTASGSVNFGVIIPPPTSLSSKDTEPVTGIDISRNIKEPVIFGGTNYKPKSAFALTARSLPWVLLQLLAVVYLVLAYRQARQNKLLKRTLILTNQTRENIENFVSIITHYLGTSVSVISLAADAVPPLSPQRAAVEEFKPVAARLKEYANDVISRLEGQAEPIKKGLERGGLVTRNSIYKWVLIPSVVALVMMLVSYIGIFGLWVGETGKAVLGIALLVGGVVAALIFFEVWQRQRQLKIDLALTTNNAEKALQIRRDLIATTQESLARQVEIIQKQGQLVNDPAFQKRFAGGLAQLSQVSDGFTSILQLTSAVSAGTVRAYLPIKQAINGLELQANEKHQKLLLDEPASITTKLLPKELEHILTTLVQNSIQFSPEGGEIKVRARGKQHFELKVTDEGIGINKDQKAQLMQPFSRGTSTKTYDHEGLGLNLYLTRLIAEKYKGSVDIQSIEGKGTTVIVKI